MDNGSGIHAVRLRPPVLFYALGVPQTHFSIGNTDINASDLKSPQTAYADLTCKTKGPQTYSEPKREYKPSSGAQDPREQRVQIAEIKAKAAELRLSRGDQ